MCVRAMREREYFFCWFARRYGCQPAGTDVGSPGILGVHRKTRFSNLHIETAAFIYAATDGWAEGLSVSACFLCVCVHVLLVMFVE